MTEGIKDKVSVITGASSGLGKANIRIEGARYPAFHQQLTGR